MADVDGVGCDWTVAINKGWDLGGGETASFSVGGKYAQKVAPFFAQMKKKAWQQLSRNSSRKLRQQNLQNLN